MSLSLVYSPSSNSSSSSSWRVCKETRERVHQESLTDCNVCFVHIISSGHRLSTWCTHTHCCSCRVPILQQQQQKKKKPFLSLCVCAYLCVCVFSVQVSTSSSSSSSFVHRRLLPTPFVAVYLFKLLAPRHSKTSRQNIIKVYTDALAGAYGKILLARPSQAHR